MDACDPLETNRCERIRATARLEERRREGRLSASTCKHKAAHRRRTSAGWLLVWLLVAASAAATVARAQFLFTYEINQESDDSRAPKSSLFDPSAFKIVTPSQLQSSYQKLAAQPPEQAPMAPALAGALAAPPVSQSPSQPQLQSSATPSQQQETSAAGPASFLKQTSAAIESLAELFSLSPSSSPSPLGSAAVATATATASPESHTNIDQQAEARSLHEHWTQQQQRAHSAGALQSFTTSPSAPPPAQQQSASRNSSPASYWLTSNPLAAGADGNFLVEIKTSPQQEQPLQSLSGTPTSTAGNLVDNLLAVSQQPETGRPAHFGMPAQRPSTNGQPSATPSPLAAPAQSSFMSTPTSYYPQASPRLIQQTQAQSAAAQPPQTLAPNEHNSFGPTQRQQLQQQQQTSAANFQPQTQALHQHQARSLAGQAPAMSAAPQPQRATAFTNELLEGAQLQPPANQPQGHNFEGPAITRQPQRIATLQNSFKPLKSAEESLLAFREQQQSQHDQQAAVQAAAQQLASQQQSQQFQQSQPHRPRPSSERAISVALGASDNSLDQDQFVSEQPSRQQQQQQTNVLAQPSAVRTREPVQHEIPKVSPQIYESFLLQQKDQYEKHMELLKQQQELNRLLEQKQREEAAKRNSHNSKQDIQRTSSATSRKKEELERVELRKKAAARAEQEQQLQAARKARQEAEEARRKQLERSRQEEEAKEKQRAATEEERRYREFLEARRKQEEAEAAAAAAAAATAAQAKREQELREQRELREAAEVARRRQEAEAKERRDREQYRAYLRQQEELKKLLELKQREDEAVQAAARRRRPTLTSATVSSSSMPSTSTTPAPPVQARQSGSSTQASRANKLALEHKERVRQLGRAGEARQREANQLAATGTSLGWGGRATRSRAQQPSEESRASSSSTSVELATTTAASTQAATTPLPSTATSAAFGVSRARQLTASQPRNQQQLANPRKLKADERLIRQKIPNYTGAGKYGLFQTGNSSNSFAELVALLESVTLPASSSTTSTSTSTSTTTPAPTTNAGSSLSTLMDDLEPAEAPQAVARSSAAHIASSLSPLLNARDLNVTPTPFATSFSTGEPLGASTAMFDDDVPRRPVSRLATARTSQPPNQQQPPQMIAGAASQQVSSRLAHRSGHVIVPPRNISTTAARSSAHIGLASLPADSDNDGIPGRAGHEYPVLGVVPNTSFSCAKQPLNGYYADTETACQVVHLCQGGVQSSILCPNGTIFNQEKFSCQWWYEVNCSRAPMFYQLNDNLYKLAGDDSEPAKLPSLANSAQVKLSAANEPAKLQRQRGTNNL